MDYETMRTVYQEISSTISYMQKYSKLPKEIIDYQIYTLNMFRFKLKDMEKKSVEEMQKYYPKLET